MPHAHYGNEAPEMEETDYTVEDLTHDTILNTVYPKTVLETRYGGTYSGGKWAAFANIENPRDTDGFGSDVPCGEFWSKGPKHELNGEKFYAVAHDTPQEALELLAEAIREDMKDENIVTIEDEFMGEVTGYYDPESKTFTVSEMLTPSTEPEEE